MEDNLIIFQMEDNLNFFKMEDDLNFFQNGRQPQFLGKYIMVVGTQPKMIIMQHYAIKSKTIVVAPLRVT
jgi:hypothetical protein